MKSPTVRRHWPSELGMCFALALMLSLFAWMDVVIDDEFTLLSDAARLLQGELIYRDFFQFTGPVTHWIAAGSFLAAGQSLLAARVAGALLMLLAGWQLYHLGRRLGLGPWVAVLPSLSLVLVLHRLLPGFSHHWVVLPFVLGAMQAAIRGLDTHKPAWWALAGAAAAVACLTMQSDGLMVSVLLAAFLLLQRWGMRNPTPLGRSAIAYALGWALPIGATAAFFAAHGALSNAWYHLWDWPLAHYKSPGGVNDVAFGVGLAELVGPLNGWFGLPVWLVRATAFGGVFLLLAATALVALVWGLAIVGRRLWGGVAFDRAQARFGLVGLVALGSFLVAARGRADVAHVAAYGAPALLLATVLAQSWRDRCRGLVRWLPLAGLSVLALSGALLLAQGIRHDPGAWLTLSTPDQRIKVRPALRYLRERVAPGDRLAGMPAPGQFYFYAAPPATRYTLMLPPEKGYNTEAEFRAAWEAIRRERPRFIVVTPWHGELSTQAIMRYPLPGYAEVARLGVRNEFDSARATIYERLGP